MRVRGYAVRCVAAGAAIWVGACAGAKSGPDTRAAAPISSTSAAPRSIGTPIVLLALRDEGAVPMACWSPEGAVQEAEACAELLPKETKIAVQDGRVLALSGEADLACGGSSMKMRALSAPIDASKVDFAVWPVEALPRLKVDAGKLEPSADERAGLDGIVRAKRKDASAFDVRSGLGADLDGDGTIDHLFSGSGYAGETQAFNGVVVFFGMSPKQPVVIKEDCCDHVLFRGTLDLDGGAARALVVQQSYVEPGIGQSAASEGVARFVDRGLTFRGFGCRAF